MYKDRNWAEHDRRIENAPTLDECRKTGVVHHAYGWAKTPWGGWNAEQQQAYFDGYEAAENASAPQSAPALSPATPDRKETTP